MTTLDALARRVNDLAQDVASGAEVLQPNYLTIDPNTGVVGADFTGVISALGVTLPSGDTLTPPATNRVRWVRQSDGSVLADIFGASLSVPPATPKRTIRLLAHGNNSEPEADAVLQALNDDTNDTALVDAQVSNGDPAVTVTTTLQFRVVLRDDGASDYLQGGQAQLSSTVFSQLFWPGGSPFSNTTNLTLFGASGEVHAVANAQGIAGTTDVVAIDVSPDGAGGVDFRGKVTGGGSPAAGAHCTFYAIMWGT